MFKCITGVCSDTSSRSVYTFPTLQPTPSASIHNEVLQTLSYFLDIVTKTKDLRGTGQETAGKGDPRIPQRRQALSALLAAQKTSAATCFTMPPVEGPLEDDVAFLKASENTEYTPEATSQFTWSKCDMSMAYQLDSEFRTRITNGVQRAQEFSTHTSPYFKAEDGSVWGTSRIEDPFLQAQAWVDVLMQLRNTYATTTKSTWANDRERIDRAGPVLVAEQRMCLSNLHPTPTDHNSQRLYALARQAIASHPISSCNTVFASRNAVAAWYMDNQENDWSASAHSATKWVKQEKAPGAHETAYETIHHRFSCESPRNIAAVVEQWMFPLGPTAQRGAVFVQLTDALEYARKGLFEQAQHMLQKLEENHPLKEWSVFHTDTRFQNPDLMADALKDFLLTTCKKPMGVNAERNLLLARDLYNNMCRQAPTAESLEKSMFFATHTWPFVARCALALKKGHLETILFTLTQAREALKQEIHTTSEGFQKHALILLDTQLSRLTSAYLGLAVQRCTPLETPEQCALAMAALHTALHDIQASNLHHVYSNNDARAFAHERFTELVARTDDVMKEGRITQKDFHILMQEGYAAIRSVVQNIRFFTDERALALTDASITTDPEFLDQWVKETALHYGTAITEMAMRVGLKEQREKSLVANIKGMRVLNSVGPVVFSKVVFADTAADLLALKPPRDALCIVQSIGEKKMVSVAGVIVDAASAPGGNSHINMYAMNNGMTVLALPLLRTQHLDFLRRIAREGGVFINDQGGSTEICSVKHALKTHKITAEDVEKLKPGLNKHIHYLTLNSAATAWEETAEHTVLTSPHRPLRDIVLYCPQDEVRGIGKKCATFKQLASLGTYARPLSGEKGLVLALMSEDPVLAPHIPQGSVVTTGRVSSLLRDAGLSETWNAPWTLDPKVGLVTDANFLQSAFYTDHTYRTATLKHLYHTSYEKLCRLLIDKETGTPTEAGQTLYDELLENGTLKTSDSWIARSSFTCEDRPGKSGAGQYESYPHLTTPVERLEGIVKVICSGWLAEPIENNVAEEINIQHIMPAVVVQECIKADFSGVAVSRGDNNTRGHITVQCVKGFGGGVDGSHAEEGLITESGYTLRIPYTKDAPPLIEDPTALAALRTLVLHIEKLFHTTLEKGKGYAVDVEFVRVHETWKAVQARVLLTHAT